MTHVDCPWCDGPAIVPAAVDAVECPECGISVPLATDLVAIEAIAA